MLGSSDLETSPTTDPGVGENSLLTHRLRRRRPCEWLVAHLSDDFPAAQPGATRRSALGRSAAAPRNLLHDNACAQLLLADELITSLDLLNAGLMMEALTTLDLLYVNHDHAKVIRSAGISANGVALFGNKSTI